MKRAAKLRPPTATGRAALRDLGRVPWAELDHCYGTGAVGPALAQDVRATLAALGEPERFDEASNALWSNVCHQDTIYEATAHAVPFLAAVAQDPALSKTQVVGLAVLLGHIGVAAAWETDDGGQAGSFGEGVAESTRAALVASRVWISALAERCPEVADSTAALVALAEAPDPTDGMVAALRGALDELESLEIEDDAEPAAPTGPAEWVRHAKFGVGRVLARAEGKVRVAFGGDERVLVASVLASSDPPP